MRDLKTSIRSLPDFPKPGITFYDIGTLLADGPAWRDAVEGLAAILRPLRPDVLIGIESRGFLVAAPVAAALGIGMVMLRKPGKLPGKTISHSYTLEYGSDTVEMQEGILRPGPRAVICDDLLATGGTAAAAITLARRMGAEVLQLACLIELAFLNGRAKLDVPVSALVNYSE